MKITEIRLTLLRVQAQLYRWDELWNLYHTACVCVFPVDSISDPHTIQHNIPSLCYNPDLPPKYCRHEGLWLYTLNKTLQKNKINIQLQNLFEVTYNLDYFLTIILHWILFIWIKNTYYFLILRKLLESFVLHLFQSMAYLCFLR